eukprot:TRINITY_DN10794_c0_g1_i1.p1 TRINITY_DN10794_c0_g1~~TRINITY_DN10794_c0_g1_i1.p1  ORF type:complete len:1278 (-),score=266.38 TRINITY_DN10794_c0_g1_i1:267-4100(-)
MLALLEDAQRLVQSCTNVSLFTEIATRESTAEEFSTITSDLASTASELGFEINIAMFVNQQQDREDRERDAIALDASVRQLGTMMQTKLAEMQSVFEANMRQQSDALTEANASLDAVMFRSDDTNAMVASLYEAHRAKAHKTGKEFVKLPLSCEPIAFESQVGAEVSELLQRGHVACASVVLATQDSSTRINALLALSMSFMISEDAAMSITKRFLTFMASNIPDGDENTRYWEVMLCLLTNFCNSRTHAETIWETCKLTIVEKVPNILAAHPTQLLLQKAGLAFLVRLRYHVANYEDTDAVFTRLHSDNLLPVLDMEVADAMLASFYVRAIRVMCMKVKDEEQQKRFLGFLPVDVLVRLALEDGVAQSSAFALMYHPPYRALCSQSPQKAQIRSCVERALDSNDPFLVCSACQLMQTFDDPQLFVRSTLQRCARPDLQESVYLSFLLSTLAVMANSNFDQLKECSQEIFRFGAKLVTGGISSPSLATVVLNVLSSVTRQSDALAEEAIAQGLIQRAFSCSDLILTDDVTLRALELVSALVRVSSFWKVFGAANGLGRLNRHVASTDVRVKRRTLLIVAQIARKFTAERAALGASGWMVHALVAARGASAQQTDQHLMMRSACDCCAALIVGCEANATLFLDNHGASLICHVVTSAIGVDEELLRVACNCILQLLRHISSHAALMQLNVHDLTALAYQSAKTAPPRILCVSSFASLAAQPALRPALGKSSWYSIATAHLQESAETYSDVLLDGLLRILIDTSVALTFLRDGGLDKVVASAMAKPNHLRPHLIIVSNLSIESNAVALAEYTSQIREACLAVMQQLGQRLDETNAGLLAHIAHCNTSIGALPEVLANAILKLCSQDFFKYTAPIQAALLNVRTRFFRTPGLGALDFQEDFARQLTSVLVANAPGVLGSCVDLLRDKPELAAAWSRVGELTQQLLTYLKPSNEISCRRACLVLRACVVANAQVRERVATREICVLLIDIAKSHPTACQYPLELLQVLATSKHLCGEIAGAGAVKALLALKSPTNRDTLAAAYQILTEMVKHGHAGDVVKENGYVKLKDAAQNSQLLAVCVDLISSVANFAQHRYRKDVPATFAGWIIAQLKVAKPRLETDYLALLRMGNAIGKDQFTALGAKQADRDAAYEALIKVMLMFQANDELFQRAIRLLSAAIRGSAANSLPRSRLCKTAEFARLVTSKRHIPKCQKAAQHVLFSQFAFSIVKRGGIIKNWKQRTLQMSDSTLGCLNYIADVRGAVFVFFRLTENTESSERQNHD